MCLVVGRSNETGGGGGTNAGREEITEMNKKQGQLRGGG